ncbi:hypothetical protein G7Z17_g8839 [Cylindrodendrum hubeiense]|uniref:Methyltransferase type 11 domain-containing protein n=1 Tax=Cylindrodendrum hubeiense TaxID=595255 RepID=A0A9P5LCT3_9HYPO|nr:hypothetical protein G7Z17_g8839 [Cylindrodendrum hubeiense]
MSVFFIGWELWQEMTFVLACCIILVFAIGLTRLRLTNRAVRRLEIIDEEKRARLSVMSHCGIDALRPPEVPFGVRAIQNGIEVEGIWISRPNTPDLSRTATPTTMVALNIDTKKGKKKILNFETTKFSSVYLAPETLHAPATGNLNLSPNPGGDRSSSLKSRNSPPKLLIHQYTPKGFRDDRHRSDASALLVQSQTHQPPNFCCTVQLRLVFVDMWTRQLYKLPVVKMVSTHVIHDAASKGFHNALSYDAHRPSYGDAAVSSLLKHLNLEGKPHSRIVDLGAGTGKFTEVLAARPEEFEIVAVEPLDSMRETLAEKRLKGVETRAGTASKMDTIETGWADGCIVAQAFHCWPATTAWEYELEELSFSGHFDGQPRFRHLQWREVFDRQAETDEALFSTPIGTERVQWSVWLTPEGLWDRINTLSWNAIREGESKREFRDKFDKILKEGDGKWNDQGEIEVHGSTFFAWTERL